MSKLNEVKVIDTRETYIYNGWSYGNNVGGHVENAVNFSFLWLNLLDCDVAITDELSRLNINKNDEIHLYGKKSSLMYQKFISLGYVNMSVIEEDFREYVKSYKVYKLKNYEKLVYPNWIDDLINKKDVEGFSGDNFIVFEASFGMGELYELGHIPGAVHINTNEFEEEPLWNRKSDSDIEEAILNNGITVDTTVILYGPDTTSAARIAAILRYAGVDDVRILDGGYQAWKRAGLKSHLGNVKKKRVDSFGAVIPSNPKHIIDLKEAKSMIEHGNIISIRSWEEYTGEDSGYSYIKSKGRIAGSLHGQDTNDNRNVDGTMFNYELMFNNWKERGIVNEKANAFYCGTGWRASESLFYADIMGFENISLFDGGWYEWSTTENPIEVGEPNKVS